MAAWMRHPNTEAASPSVYPSSQPNSEQCKEPPTTLPTERKGREGGKPVTSPAADTQSGRRVITEAALPKLMERSKRTRRRLLTAAGRVPFPFLPPGAVHLCLGVVCSSFDGLLWRWIARRPLALHRPPY